MLNGSPMLPRKLSLIMAALAAFAATSSVSAAIVVDTLVSTTTGAEDEWYAYNRGGGDSSIVDLTGAGGALESDQPLPSSAVKLTTGFANPDGAEVGTILNLGAAADVLKSIDLGYSFFKQFVAGSNMAAAPSLKLAIYSASGTGAGDFDSYGQLIFEPSWNGGNPATDTWVDVAIDENTGSGATGSGGWWWTGGFGLPSGAAGPPIRSLSEWADLFAAGGDSADFATANVVGVSLGIGTYNQGQIDYVDNVRIATGSIDKTYDFESPKAVPDSGTTVLSLFGALALIASMRRRIGR